MTSSTGSAACKVARTLGAAALFAAVLSAAPPAAQKVTITATEYAFAPATIHATAGQPLEITLVNKGKETHGLRLVFSYGEVPFPENVPPGATMSATFVDLGKPGTYRFYCPVDEHDPHGMHGTLVVAQGGK
jgi:plastocyanin